MPNFGKSHFFLNPFTLFTHSLCSVSLPFFVCLLFFIFASFLIFSFSLSNQEIILSFCDFSLLPVLPNRNTFSLSNSSPCLTFPCFCPYHPGISLLEGPWTDSRRRGSRLFGSSRVSSSRGGEGVEVEAEVRNSQSWFVPSIPFLTLFRLVSPRLVAGNEGGNGAGDEADIIHFFFAPERMR